MLLLETNKKYNVLSQYYCWKGNSYNRPRKDIITIEEELQKDRYIDISKRLSSTCKLINCKFRFYIKNSHLVVIITNKSLHSLRVSNDNRLSYGRCSFLSQKDTSRSLFSSTAFKIKSYMTGTN